MKKTLFIAVLMTTAFPLFANASWWNPISWFSFLYPKPQIVEKIIYIQATSTPEIIESSGTPTPVIQSTKSSIEKPVIVKKPINISSSPKPTPIVKIPTPIVNDIVIDQSDHQQDYLNLLTGYTKLEETVKIKLDYYGRDTFSYNLIDAGRIKFLTNISTQISNDNDALSKLSNIQPKTLSLLSVYQNNFASITSSLNAEEKEYTTNIARYQAASFISDNEFKLTDLGVHLRAADYLVRYDKAFGTNYAQLFMNAKTVQETAEFANMFLIDTGNRK